MAYNLQSLITILEQILNPQQTRWILDHNKPELESLLEKSASLKQNLENSSITKIESLESEIRDAARKAEDMIESHMVDQMLSNPRGVSFTFTTPDLHQVMQQLDSVTEQVVKLMEGKTTTTGGPLSSVAASASPDVSSKSVVVGLDDVVLQLKDRLTGDRSKLEIVPIVGMGGIGKTTLARKLYNDPSVHFHFKCLAWITISQDYDVRAILLGLLGCIIGKEVDQHVEKKNHLLKDILYQSLYGRRYIIVLDDMWSSKVWDEIRMYFPDNNNRSRIVITTRESDVARGVNSQSKQHEMQLLNKSESWDLLRQEVFGDQEDFPASLERIGRNIASNCRGLPLAIHVIGGLLCEVNRAQDVWESVANDVGAVFGGKDEFSNILSLSYNHLPSHLRPCFLYMGAFPEDHEIKASRLVRLWVAEGFLKPNGDKSSEEVAEDCLRALVARNLVSVRALKCNGRAKRFVMHDLMRDLCLKKAEEQRFVHVKSRRVGKVENESMYSLRRVSLHPSYRIRDVYASTEFMEFARCFLCTGLASRAILSDVFLGLRLLRVLDVFDIKFIEFPTEVLHIVNLRYLAFSCISGKLPSDISRLCNLQTLVVWSSASIILLSEMLQMAELRHVKFSDTNVDAEFYTAKEGFILEKLQSICTIRCPSNGFFRRIPNIKNLTFCSWDSEFDLFHLHKLETLKFFGGSVSTPLLARSTLILPHSLRKLSLGDCDIVVEFIDYLCELPNLEVLKLQKGCTFKGGEPEEWNATQQEFCQLQFLLLERLQLVHWQADETNFPRLRRLVIRGCSALEEIPSGIGEIPTLQTIELDRHSSPSLVASAELIIEEQRENGNNELQLRM